MIISHPFSYESLDFIKEGGNCLVEFFGFNPEEEVSAFFERNEFPMRNLGSNPGPLFYAPRENTAVRGKNDGWNGDRTKDVSVIAVAVITVECNSYRNRKFHHFILHPVKSFRNFSSLENFLRLCEFHSPGLNGNGVISISPRPARWPRSFPNCFQ